SVSRQLPTPNGFRSPSSKPEMEGGPSFLGVRRSTCGSRRELSHIFSESPPMAEPTTPQLPSELPVLPLRRTVAFPLTLQPLAVNRPVSIETVNRALGSDRMVLLLLQHSDADDPGPEDVHRVGTVGIVRQMAKTPGGINIIIEGIARVRADVVTRTGT